MLAHEVARLKALMPFSEFRKNLTDPEDVCQAFYEKVIHAAAEYNIAFTELGKNLSAKLNAPNATTLEKCKAAEHHDYELIRLNRQQYEAVNGKPLPLSEFEKILERDGYTRELARKGFSVTSPQYHSSNARERENYEFARRIQNTSHDCGK